MTNKSNKYGTSPVVAVILNVHVKLQFIFKHARTIKQQWCKNRYTQTQTLGL